MEKKNQAAEKNELLEAIKYNTFVSAMSDYNRTLENISNFNIQSALNRRNGSIDDVAIRNILVKEEEKLFVNLTSALCLLCGLYLEGQVPNLYKPTVEAMVLECMNKPDGIIYKIVMDRYKDFPNLSIVTLWNKIRTKK